MRFLSEAEGEGFEPSSDLTARNGFRDRRIRPLCHPSRPTRGGVRGGEGGIRTLEGGMNPLNALAGRCLQPLGHFSGQFRRTGYPIAEWRIPRREDGRSRAVSQDGFAGRHLSHSRRISRARLREDRKSTRLNSSHEWISYAVFCLKKKPTLWYLQPPFDKNNALI